MRNKTRNRQHSAVVCSRLILHLLNCALILNSTSKSRFVAAIVIWKKIYTKLLIFQEASEYFVRNKENTNLSIESVYKQRHQKCDKYKKSSDIYKIRQFYSAFWCNKTKYIWTVIILE